MNGRLGGKVIKEFPVLRAKIYTPWCLIDVPPAKNVSIQDILIPTTYQRFRSNKHSVFTEEVIKIALSANINKRINY